MSLATVYGSQPWRGLYRIGVPASTTSKLNTDEPVNIVPNTFPAADYRKSVVSSDVHANGGAGGGSELLARADVGAPAAVDTVASNLLRWKIGEEINLFRSQLGDEELRKAFRVLGLLGGAAEGMMVSTSTESFSTSFAGRSMTTSHSRTASRSPEPPSTGSRGSPGFPPLPTVNLDRVHTLNLTSCALGMPSAALILDVIPRLPKLRNLYLGGNFNARPSAVVGAKVVIVGGKPTPVGVDPTRFFALSGSIPQSVEFQKFLSGLCRVWKAHPSLVIVQLDPWLTTGHAEFQALKKERLTLQRIQSTKDYMSVGSQLASQDGKGQREGSVGVQEGQTSVLHRDPTRMSFFMVELPEQLVQATTAATLTDFREQIVHLQLAERKEREKLIRSEGITREKLRQHIRGRSGSMGGGWNKTTPTEETPISKGKERTKSVGIREGETTFAPTDSSNDVDVEQPVATRSRLGSVRTLETSTMAICQLEEELRDMLEQRELDSRSRLRARLDAGPSASGKNRK